MYDFSIMTYNTGSYWSVIYNLSIGEIFHSYFNVNPLGDHFVPNLFIFAFLYKIYPTTLWILYVKAIAYVWSGWCIYKLIDQVDFVDIDPNTGLMRVDKLNAKLIHAKKNNCLPKIIIPVHLGGNSCDMESIYNLSKEYKFKIIEDSSHAIGGKYKGNYIGNCKYSSINIFSFHPVKIITTGEGGLATTNNFNLYKLNYSLINKNNLSGSIHNTNSCKNKSSSSPTKYLILN